MSFTVQLDITAYDVESEYERWLCDTADDVAKLDGFSAPRVSRQLPTSKPQVVFVLGGPGAGKGTQCARIQEKFGYKHISAGDCLRAERSSGSKDADLINNCIKEGAIVPVEITVKLLLKAMEESGQSKFLIDGFPRNADNLDGWNRVVGTRAQVQFVLFFDAPEAVMETRLLKRGETSGRADDNIESIRKRFRTYREASMPIIYRFESLGKVRYVNADQNEDAVFFDVSRIITGLNKELAPTTARYTVQFDVASQAAYDAYRATKAPAIQDAATKKFGNKVMVSSRSYTTNLVKSSARSSVPRVGLAVAVGVATGALVTSLLLRR